jgi:hypothetical protein
MVDSKIKAFRQRWQAVEKIEQQEQRTASIATRWQQLNAILRLAIGMGLWPRQEDGSEIEVRERWVRLKGAG